MAYRLGAQKASHTNERATRGGLARHDISNAWSFERTMNSLSRRVPAMETIKDDEVKRYVDFDNRQRVKSLGQERSTVDKRFKASLS